MKDRKQKRENWEKQFGNEVAEHFLPQCDRAAQAPKVDHKDQISVSVSSTN